MPSHPEQVLSSLKRTLRDCERLAQDADRWSAAGSKPRISRSRAESMVELAYLRSYLAWEVFLEEAFVLYLMGKKAPRAAKPRRFTFPPSRALAKDWVREGRSYTTWDAPTVRKRAQRYFKDGEPFEGALSGSQQNLQDAKTVRNAIAHDSDVAVEKFQILARNQLGALPPRLTAGRFLVGVKPGSAPPVTFLEFYLAILERVAEAIVPT